MLYTVPEQGVFNIPGADTLPLTKVIELWGRPSIAMPETGIYWTYKLRQHLRGGQFRYGMNRRRFHYSGILDGRRAMEVLRYVPSQAISYSSSHIDIEGCSLRCLPFLSRFYIDVCFW